MIQGFQRDSRGVRIATRRSTSARWGAVLNMVRAEVAFLVFTGVCVALHPGFVLKGNEGGLSDYGVHLKTALPYTLSLVLLVAYNLRAASLVTDVNTKDPDSPIPNLPTIKFNFQLPAAAAYGSGRVGADPSQIVAKVGS